MIGDNMKSKILIIIPTLTGGGAERIASNLSIHLSEEYHRHIVMFDAKKIDYAYKGEVIDLNTKVIDNPLGKIMNFLIRIYKVRKIKNELKIDVAISLMEGPNIINIFTKQRDKVIISVRNFKSKSTMGFYGKLYKLLMKVFYNKADIIVAVSKVIKRDLIENFGLNEEKIMIIYNFYDIKKINELAKEVLEDEYIEIFNNPVVITAGSLTRQKGHWHLIRTFKKVKEEVPDAMLVILGRGNLEAYLKKLTKDLGLEKDVHFLGYKKNPFKYIGRSTIYAFPSLFEGFPNALCEAMACSVPVISSDCKSGPREILAPDTDIEQQAKGIEYAKHGILLPVCDGNYYDAGMPLTSEERLLQKTIIKILSNKKMKEEYKTKSKEGINRFQSDIVIKQWEKLISL
jgi:glycosyltransferase involved in cell wall biosynthesis